MKLFIGADHRGFELKNKLIEYIQEKDIRIEDLGNYQYEPEDDYPDYAKKVAEAVLQDPENSLGIVICGSGVGVDIAANRYRGIRCGLAISEEQVGHIRENDHITILALSADSYDFEAAKTFVDRFLEAQPKKIEKYLRRARKLDELEVKPGSSQPPADLA